MKRQNRYALALVSSLAFGAYAGPLQRSDVPADPAWVVHLDCDRLRSTVLGKWLLGELDKPEAQSKIDSLQAVTGVDVRRQIHGATLFSTSSNPADGVLVLYADFDPERLTTIAKSAREYESSAHGKHTIHSWLDENKKNKDGSLQRTYAAIHKSRVIFGQRESTVAATLDVLDDTSRTLAKSGNLARMGDPGSGMFFQAAARKVDMAENDPNAAVFRLSKLIRLDLGELNERVAATITFETKSEEVAKTVSTILEGVVSLVKVQNEKPVNVKIAEAITLKSEASNVVATLNMPASSIVEMLNSEINKKKAKENKL